MKEANPVKFYFARYFFLAISLLQGLAALLMILQFEDTPKNRFASFVIFTFAMIFGSLHLIVANKIKRVAISKKKISVIQKEKTKNYDWSDVKELRFISFLNMYCLKLKGKRTKIYFLSAEDNETIFSLFTNSSELIPKR